MARKRAIIYEFHISRLARDRYQFDQSLFTLSGNVIFADFHAVRVFVNKVNQKRDLVRFPEQSMKPGQVNAMGLIDEILHFIVSIYRDQVNPNTIQQLLTYLNEHLGEVEVETTLHRFADEFPPLKVYRRETSLVKYLDGETKGVPHRHVVLEELLMLWIANANPAFSPYMEFFDDSRLEKETQYQQIISEVINFFNTQPPFGPDSQNLVLMLRSPAIAVPHSLTGQLEFIREHWGALLGRYLFRLLSGLDLIQEEDRAIILGPGPSRVYDFSGLAIEAERFSPDSAWMPSLVLLAKNVYVWLDQLSKKFQRPIHRLDQVPDEELDLLAKWGFTGLWLIGLWERSQASKKIKQMRGNPDAVASAYSLFTYDIAGGLGGEESLSNLRERAQQRGIRLASDMVPNHMGIDSRWVIEHPHWFITLDYSPFPSYTFNGQDLSWDERVGLYLEDHYYDGTDAAVVFKRVDHWSGASKYIYHGNDGTSMPWNDTAQLNYLIPEVREAVIQTILHVARKFPIIRFDAAMTLAKKHYQRLWFPRPGTGGAIPTRAEHGMSKEQFDELFPKEFWREVVDRVALEVPDTLLLAEAFWLMEGYFVRTLGMHRVYNSAFMNMLRDEKNQEYRLVIKNTLEFDPEILKRYVNFMNNPDERTAVDQFGKGDKYFGICALMATMPGLPMFGHGQIEGYAEKYGMEFHRAYWDETPDQNLIQRHEREIFPLLRRRHIFAEAKDFLLYDFYSPEGFVNEDVYAYSNRRGNEHAIVVYHNKYAEARGWVKTSTAYRVKSTHAEKRQLEQKNIGESLNLHNELNYFILFRDHISGLEFIRNSQEIYRQGLYFELRAYQYHVFLDFREVRDNEWHHYLQLEAYLDSRGVPSIDEALNEILLKPIHYSFRELVNPGMFKYVISSRLKDSNELVNEELLGEVKSKTIQLIKEIHTHTKTSIDEGIAEDLANRTCEKVKALLQLAAIQELYPHGRSRKYQSAINMLKSQLNNTPAAWEVLLSWSIVHNLGSVLGEDGAAARSRSWIDEWLLGRIISTTLQDMGLEESSSWQAVEIVKLLTNHQEWIKIPASKKNFAYKVLQLWLNDWETQRFLGINRYQGILWFSKESYEKFIFWMFLGVVVEILADRNITVDQFPEKIKESFSVIQKLLDAGAKSGFQVEGLLEASRG